MLKFPAKTFLKNIFIGLIVVNILVLDFLFIKNQTGFNLFYLSEKVSEEKTVGNPTLTTVQPISTPTSIILSPTPIVVASPVQTGSGSTKETYIPIGSGSTTSSVWVPLAGVEVSFDSEKQGIIKEAYFQATLRNPTGNGEISAKLYNETDNHDVWFSQVNAEGSQTVLKETKIDLPKGSKRYRVYLKSSLGYEVFLDFARIKLIVVE